MILKAGNFLRIAVVGVLGAGALYYEKPQWFHSAKEAVESIFNGNKPNLQEIELDRIAGTYSCQMRDACIPSNSKKGNLVKGKKTVEICEDGEEYTITDNFGKKFVLMQKSEYWLGYEGDGIAGNMRGVVQHPGNGEIKVVESIDTQEKGIRMKSEVVYRCHYESPCEGGKTRVEAGCYEGEVDHASCKTSFRVPVSSDSICTTVNACNPSASTKDELDEVTSMTRMAFLIEKDEGLKFVLETLRKISDNRGKGVSV